MTGLVEVLGAVGLVAACLLVGMGRDCSRCGADAGLLGRRCPWCNRGGQR